MSSENDDKMDVSSTTAEAPAPAAPKKPKGGQPSAAEESTAPFPDMHLGQMIHQVTANKVFPGETYGKILETVLDKVGKEMQNPSLYRHLLATADVTGATSVLTEVELKEMDSKNEAHVSELKEKEAEAKESAGDMEVLDARIELARFAAKSLSKKETLDAYKAVIELPKISSGKKIDAYMESSRVASFYGDNKKSMEFIESAQKIATEGGGGDWDRRNRLKIYRGLSKLLSRDIKGASGLLLDCIATFSCNEICSYESFIFYAILSNLLHLPRPQLKKKVLDGPEILSVASDIPIVIKLAKSLYECNYKVFLTAMVEIEPLLQADRYLQPHVSYWMRELHILAHKQFLDAYQSVTLQAMADEFGVSIQFIDHHASQFIAAGRLAAKIDKYGGVIVTNRPDVKNAQYREMIQKGDLLLNRIQKLARVVDL